jgi:hypothetical protein
MKINQLTTLLLVSVALNQLSIPNVTAQSNVPENLKPPSGQVLVLKAKARGVQIYKCAVSPNKSSQFEWTLKAPKAVLVDAKGHEIIQHFGGPTWKSIDGSSVVGQVQTKVDSPSSASIPWLLLIAKTHEGNGILSKVVSIQRLDTVGGKAPSTGCTSKKLNTEVQVNYQATYYFHAEANKP